MWERVRASLSPSMLVALLALFVALAGTAWAATGGNFVLGQSNTADQATSLTSTASGAALALTDNGSGNPLRLTAPSGVAPLRVNSSVRVANLNGDLLDGLDSAEFWKLGGNGGTAPATDFLGTSDGAALSIQPGNGRVGIGTTSPLGKVDVRAAGGRAVNAVTGSNSTAIEGEAGAGGTGVIGVGDVDGVFGATDSETGAAVEGFARSKTGAIRGVFGLVDSTDGAAVVGLARPPDFGTIAGFAMRADGNTKQSRASGGWAKGLVNVAGNTLVKCFRGEEGATGQNVASCDSPWAITGSGGTNTVTFPFTVNDRFVLVTPQFAAGKPVMVTYDFPASNQVRVRTWTCSTGSTYSPCAPIGSAFTLAVF